METYLGAYVLHALEPDDVIKMQAHLTACTECQDELAALSWVPEVLRHAQLADVEPLTSEPLPDWDGPSSDLLSRLLASTKAERRRRRIRRAAAALCAAVLVAGGVVAAVSTRSHPNRSTAIRTVDPLTHVAATVTVTSRSWGSELLVSLKGHYPSGQCSLIAHASDGRADTAATWVTSSTGSADVPGATAIPANQLSELDVVTSNGWTLAHIAVPHENI